MPKITIPKPRINLRKKRKDDKFGYIRLVFRYNDQELLYPIYQGLEVKYWDNKKGETIYNKKHGQTYVDLNKEIRAIKEQTETIYNDNPNISTKAFKLELDYFTGKKKRPRQDGKKHLAFFGFIESYIEEEKNKANNKRGTWKKFITVYGNLQDYAKDKDKKIDWQDIDWNFRDDFINWMYQEPRKFSINNAAKVLEVVKQFMNVGLRRKYHSNTTHQEPKFGEQRVKLESKLILTFKELKELIALDLSSKPRWEKVRDIFIVGCYTGLRFSDWHKISDSIIIDEGEKMLEILTTKTKQLVVIPILEELQKILDKYDDQLPNFSSQEFNRIIKLVCQEVLGEKTYLKTFSESGLKKSETKLCYKDVSSHCARRSFATNFYELGVSPSELMLITGHATEKQFFEYIVLNKRKQAKKFKRLVARQLNQRYLEVAKSG